MIYFWLFLAGMVAFTISTVSGGGGALLLVPTVSFLLSASVTAPVVSLASFIGRPVRLVLFWQHIDWRIVKIYVPTALVGAFLGAWVFSSLNLEWLQIVLGLFLLSTVFQYRFGKRKRSFPVRAWYFAPVGFLVTFISTLIGATGAVLNPFYLNYGLEKEDLIGTKTVNSFLVGIVQIGSYSFFETLYGDLWLYGLALGLGAAVGNYFGKQVLGKISNQQFRLFVIALMMISGLVLLLRAFF